MAFKDSAGNQFTNHDAFKRSSAKLSASVPAAAPAAAPAADQGAPPPIESNPEAMQCVNDLQQMGYTADDVERAMGQSEGQEAAAPEGM